MSSESERIIDLYQRRAANWDADRGRSLFERPWLDRFLALVPRGGAVLDLGCGSGEPIARYFIDGGYSVTGVDSSPALISLCTERFAGHTWTVADMRSLDLGRRFDGVVAWDSFFHLTPDDQRGMFRSFGSHVAERGALLFTSGPAHGVAIGSFHGEPLYHASLDVDEYRSLLEQSGFDVVAHVVEDPACGGHTVWLAQRR
jgi:SAM-dependent methyltransferase